ncbi:MAG: 5-formyltetrahydrofolate cyclo-ligase [Eubacteriales bacterium]
MYDFADTSADKESIRLHMMKIRGNLPAREAEIAGGQIVQRILALPKLACSLPEPAVIGLYSPIRSEADILSHAALLRARGLLTALPRICGDKLVFGVVTDGKNLRPGVFGIMEPLPEAEMVQCRDFCAICIPGLAFDRTGARLGYGKGYYDRFLQLAPGDRRPLLIGVGYDFQLIDAIPQDSHDLKLDYIITPSETAAAHGFDCTGR